MPVHAKAEEVHVEAVLGGAVFDDEAGVDHARADLLLGGGKKALRRELHEREGMAFGVAGFEMPDAVRVFRDGASADIVCEEITAHLLDVGRGEGDFGEETVRSAGGYLEQFDLLMVVDGEAGPRHAGAAGCAGRKPENVGVKLARLIEVGGVKPDVRDA